MNISPPTPHVHMHTLSVSGALKYTRHMHTHPNTARTRSKLPSMPAHMPWRCLLPAACHRDEQLAKFEAYLNKEDCLHINALVRNRSRMAYPMKG